MERTSWVESLPADLAGELRGAVESGGYLVAVLRAVAGEPIAVRCFHSRTGYPYDLLLRGLKLLERQFLAIEPDSPGAVPGGIVVPPECNPDNIIADAKLSIRNSWGVASLVYGTPHVKVWRQDAPAGGKSSIHFHPRTRSTVEVVSGCVVVETFIRESPGGNLTDSVPYTLNPKSAPLSIQPGRIHRIAAIADSVVLETYNAMGEAMPEEFDIVRLTGMSGKEVESK